MFVLDEHRMWLHFYIKAHWNNRLDALLEHINLTSHQPVLPITPSRYNTYIAHLYIDFHFCDEMVHIGSVHANHFTIGGVWYYSNKWCTVKPVLKGHLWDQEKVALQDRWPFKRDSIHLKFSMTGQDKKWPFFRYRGLLNRGDRIGRFDCMY